MSVDLTELIPFLQAEVSAPGSDQFPAATDDVWLTYLINGFWMGRLDGMMKEWTCDVNGVITPIATGGADMSRDLQQLVIFLASFTALRNALQAANTLFRAKAGTVEFETQQSASTLKEILKSLTEQRAILMRRLSDIGVVTPAYIDAVVARTNSIMYGDIYFVGH